MIGGAAAGGLGDADRCDAGVGRERGSDSFVHGVSDKPGDALGRRVDGVERGALGQIGVAEGIEQVAEGGLDGVEVAEQAVGVDLGAFEDEHYTEVMPVDGFSRARDGQGVGGAELVLDADREQALRVSRWGGAG